MKTSIIQNLTENFEAHANQTSDGVEFWMARDLQHLLNYTKWDNFLGVISKAKTACELSEQEIEDHFADVGKMVAIGSGAEKKIPNEKKNLKNPGKLK